MDSSIYLKRIDSLAVSESLKSGLRSRAGILWSQLTPDIKVLVELWRNNTSDNQRLLVYGAGTLAVQLLHVLNKDGSDSNILAFLDGFADQRDFSGFPRPVYAVDKLIKLQFDRLVVLHPFAESIMAGNAIKSGCPEDKIIRLFSSPAYQEWEQHQLTLRLRVAEEKFKAIAIESTDISDG